MRNRSCSVHMQPVLCSALTTSLHPDATCLSSFLFLVLKATFLLTFLESVPLKVAHVGLNLSYPCLHSQSARIMCSTTLSKLPSFEFFHYPPLLYSASVSYCSVPSFMMTYLAHTSLSLATSIFCKTSLFPQFNYWKTTEFLPIDFQKRETMSRKLYINGNSQFCLCQSHISLAVQDGRQLELPLFPMIPPHS